MHYPILCRLLGSILAMLAMAMGLCFILAIVEAMQGRDDHASHAMGVSCLITAAASAVLFAFSKGAKPESLLRKEAIATVGLGWIIGAFFGSLPFVLGQTHLSWAQAYFESVSGFTTTGSTVLTGLDTMPDAILLWRSLSQWIGGLGILALIVALLSTYGVSGKSLIGAETSMNLGDSPTSRIKDLTFRLWTLYGGLTVSCWLGLWLIGSQGTVRMTGFEALNYALTTVSTGGFAPHDASIGHFDSAPVEVFLSFFMLVSSFNLILVVNYTMGNFQAKTGRTEGISLILIIGLALGIIILDLWLNHEAAGWAAARDALFPIASLASSTGFASGDYDQWPLFARCVLLIIMAIGGCSGSTAGGIKIVRLIVMLRVLKQEVKKSFRPNQVFAIKLDGQTVDADFQRQVLTYLVFTATVVAVSTAAVSLFEPGITDLNTACGAVFATFFNMGPGFGSVGPTDNFAHLHQSTLLFLSLLMLLGRLEIFVVLALFSRSLWARY